MTDYTPNHTGLLPSPGIQAYGQNPTGSMPSGSGDNANNPSAMEDTALQHYVIGDNLRAKAFYEDAIEEFQRALHIQEPLLHEKAPMVLAKTHYSVGLAYRGTKDFPQALYHLNKASTIYEDLLAPPSNVGESKADEEAEKPDPATVRKELTDCKLNLARVHHSNGVDLQRSGSYDQSIVEHRKALAIREHFLGRTHLETARSYYVMGCALSDRGDFDEALAELRRTLRTRLLIFGHNHRDSQEVLENISTVLSAKGSLAPEEVGQYKVTVIQSLELETSGDQHCRVGDFENGMVCYRKSLALEEQCLGDLHPTTCDLYLRMADALGELGDLEASLNEYKSAIMIYERLMGKFHVKVANIYNKLAGILMDKGEYETALSFYAKAYGIYDSVLGNHDDTKQAMMNLRLAAARERSAKESMDLLKRAEDDFKERQEESKKREKALLEKEAEMIKGLAKHVRSAPPPENKPAPKPEPAEDII